MEEKKDNPHATLAQNDFLKSTYEEFDKVYQAPKESMWDSQEGEQDEKSVFVTKVAFNTLIMAVTTGVLIILACTNKAMKKTLLEESLIIVASLLLLGLGYVLWTRKDVRENQGVSFWLFIVWLGSLAVLCASLFTYTGAGRTLLTIALSKIAAVVCVYMACSKTKKIDNIKKNMVVGFIMTMLLIIVSVCTAEYMAKGEGVMGGAILLTLSMLVGGLTCFYLTFALTKIQLPEAEQDLSDVMYFSVRIYVDVIYAIFLVLALLWDKVWNGSPQ